MPYRRLAPNKQYRGIRPGEEMKDNSLEQRFWDKVKKGKPNECWEWLRPLRKDGYAQIRRTKGAYTLAHRISWELHNGEIPKGKGHHGTCVLHACDNRKCVNPNHLFLGTQKDNVRDMVKKGRNSKLTEEVVKIIRELYKRPDLTQYDLADEFNLSVAQICRIINKKRWKHV